MKRRTEPEPSVPAAHGWDDPFAKLREKWATIPLNVDGDRVDTKTLLAETDDQLVERWQRARDADNSLDVRGWYRILYQDYARGRKILDIGCGFAYDSITFAQNGAYVLCVDIVQSNLELVSRVAQRLGVGDRVSVHYMDGVHSLKSLPSDFDALLAVGSLHNAPSSLMKDEVLELARRLRTGGRWLQLAYPKARWEREGSLPFDEWAPLVDGPGTPWEEWYDIPKLLALLEPARFEPLLYYEFHNHDFNWFDLVFHGF